MFRGLFTISATVITALSAVVGVVAVGMHRLADVQRQADASWRPGDPPAHVVPSTAPATAPSPQSAADPVPQTTSIELWAADAAVHGEVTLADRKKKTVPEKPETNVRVIKRIKMLQEMGGHPITTFLVNFKQPDDYAEWTLNVPRSDRYEVDVTYSCSNWEQGGLYAVSVGDANVKMTAEATRGENAFRVATIGNLTLKAGKATLRFHVDPGSPKRHEIRLRSIQLIADTE